MQKSVVFELDSSLSNVEYALDCAKQMIDDLSEDYFLWDAKEKARRILYDYSGAATRCHIAQDYLFRIGKAVENLQKLVNSMSMESVNKETEVRA